MRYFIAFIAVVSIAIFGLPYLIQDQAIRWLKTQGVVEPKFEDIEFEWLSGAIILKGLYAKADNKPLLQVDELKFELNYKSIFDKRLLVDQLVLSGFNSGVKQTPDAFYVGPIDINQFNSKQPEAPQPDQEPTDWQFGIKEVLISDITFSTDIKPFKQQLKITQASIKDIYQWDQAIQTSFDLTGSLNNSPLIINSTGTPLAEHKESKLQLNIQNFAVESVTSGIIPQLSGVLDLKLDLNLDLNNLTGSLAHNGSIDLSSLAWQEKQQSIALGKLQWQGKGELAVQNGLIQQTNVDGVLDLKQLALTQKGKDTIKLAALNWQGPMQLAFEKGQIKQLTIADNITVADLFFKQAATKVMVKKLVTNAGKKAAKKPISIALINGAPASISVMANASVSGLQFSQTGVSLTAKTLSVSGPVNLSSLAKSAKITAKPTLKSTSLKLKLDKNLAISSGAVQLSSQLNKMDLTKPVISNINLNLSNFSINSLTQSLNIASLSQLNLSNANYSAKSLTLNQLNIKKLKIASVKKSAGLTAINDLKIQQLKLINQNKLTIKQISMAGSNSNIHIDVSGKLPLIEKLQSAIAGKKATKTSTNQDSKKSTNTKFSYSIGKIVASGNNQIQIEDKSVDPWFKSKLNLTALNISALNNNSSNPIPVALKAKINDSATLDFNGSLTAFAKSKSGKWSLNLQSLSMPVISPYAGKFSGYFLESGKISLNSSGVINANVIKGKNKIKIQQLSVRSAGSKATSKTNSSLNMPLDVAISVLEDDEGNIKLSVPVTGSIDDPNFGYSSVVEIIAKKGLKQAAFGILSKALQPYGALITIATTAIEAQENGTFINLAPISFSPGKSGINKNMRGYLVKIANMMKTRKKLKLKICATGVLQDKTILSPEILKANAALEKPATAKTIENSIKNVIQELATNRNKAVEKELKRLKINSDRLFVCFAKTNFKNAKLKPEVSLGL